MAVLPADQHRAGAAVKHGAGELRLPSLGEFGGYLDAEPVRQPAERLTRDDVLDNITLYWLTNTGVSSARSYWENKLPYFGPKKFSIPAAVTVFPGEIFQPSRRWAERGYSNLSYFHEADKGGHFAAWEQPLLFASEMRAAFKSIR